MEIRNMFYKDIERDLKGVIKVGQDDNANIRQELEEYVVTRELQKHFRDFFDSYKRGITGSTDAMGVWISGFFGSGKSHFLKILSYLLENKVVDGKAALDYFKEDDKISDRMVLADMELAASISTDVVLFNIDSKGEQNGKQDKDAIVSVFLKVFNEMQGFCGTIPFLADLERNLSENNRFEEFKEKFEESFGSEWEEARNDFDFIQDDVVEVLVDMDFMSEESARNWCEKATGEYNISIERFADMVRKYIERKGNNHHVVFLVDEIGQYIGDDSRLMLNLQTVTEDLGTACKGKAWIIVTSQQDIDSITKTKGNDFSKIQGRFDTRLSLSSANVDEVIRERVLKKNETAKETLTMYYDQKETIIKNLILFNDGAEKKLYADRNNFSEVYPFIPYQFNLLGSVLTSIRIHGASGKHLAEGERSMLALFKESAMRIKEKDAGTLVPFHMFYDALEQFLDHSHKGVISRALDIDALNPNHEEECFDVNVLKTLFMIKYVLEIKANVENITSLMVSHVDDDRMELAEKVENALKRLIRQTLVQKNGEVYVFLTNEEQEIETAIRHKSVDPSDVTKKASELIFDGALGERKYRYTEHNGRYAFSFNQVVDEMPYKVHANNEITLKILTPNSDEIGDETMMKMLSMQQNKSVLVVLPDDRAFLDEITATQQIEKWIINDSAEAGARADRIVADKKEELEDRKKIAKLYLEEALKAAVIYANGDRVQSNAKEIATRVNDALGKVVASVYHKLSYIDTPMNEADIKKLFQDNKQISIADTAHTPNVLALNDVKDFITLNTQRHTKTSMKSLLDRFMKPPYGFIEADVHWLVAKLFKDSEIAFYMNSQPVSLFTNTVDEIIRFITRKENYEKLMTDKRYATPEKQKKVVREVMKDLFSITAVSDDEDVIMRSFIKEAKDFKTDLEKLEIHYKNQPKYPGKNLVSDGKKLMNDVIQLTSTTEFFNTIDKNRDDYLDFAEDFEPVKNFFTGEQINIFNKAIRLIDIFEDSRSYIVDEKIEDTVRQIKNILKMAKPYKEIFKLPNLLDTYADLYNDLLEKTCGPVLEVIQEQKKRVMDELTGKQCEGKLKDRYIEIFQNLTNKAESCNNLATLQNYKYEADALKVRFLKEIADTEAKMAVVDTVVLTLPDLKESKKDGGKTEDTHKVEGKSQPKVKKNKVVSIKSVNTQTSWQVETVDDVKKYIAELEKKLLAELEEDTVLHIEF